MITEADQDALKHLEDVRVEYLEGAKVRFGWLSPDGPRPRTPTPSPLWLCLAAIHIACSCVCVCCLRFINARVCWLVHLVQCGSLVPGRAPPPPQGFRIVFVFSPNAYFDHTELTKTFTLDNFLKGDHVLREIDG
jgi:hypothetical protein